MFLRFLATVALALGRAPLGLLDESVLELRVRPGDLDINGHMTNARYLSYMDLGRTDLVVRLGLLRVAVERRWRPIVGSASVRFQRGLQPFSRYRLRTRFLCWNRKWFFFEQRFEQEGDAVAVGLVKGLLLGPRGPVPPDDVFAALGKPEPSPPMPDAVRLWLESDEAVGRASVRRS